MHIAVWTASGLVLLVILILAGWVIGRSRATPATIGGLFTGGWLIAALYNGYNGWASHGIPLLNEIAAFVPIFGIPAAAAWYWSRRANATI
jgi:hypothetical protein